MITKKDWDSLPLKVKREILSAYYGDDFEEHFVPKQFLYEYRHNFDFDEQGRRLKTLLSLLYRVNSGGIYLKLPITYDPKSTQAKFLSRPEAPKKSKAPTNKVSPVERTCWYCDYISKQDDDVAHVWCEAESKEEARSYFMSEYWDIKEIISIHK